MSAAKPRMYSGFHAVRAMLRHRPEAVLELFVLDRRAERGDPRLEELCEQAEPLGISVQRARQAVLERHAGPGHQGVVARARPLRPGDERALLKRVEGLRRPLVLALDGVMDPHNLGACLRSADGAGVDAVILPRRHACGLTPVACRTAVGAAESVPCFEVEGLPGVLGALADQGLTIVGTARGEGSVRLPALDVAPPLVVVMGAEDRGLRPAVRRRCQQLVEIPMAGEVESLNVSVATGVVLYGIQSKWTPAAGQSGPEHMDA